MDWSFLTETVLHLLAGVPLFAAVLVVLIGGRFLILLTTPLELQEDLQNAGNPAASVLLGAFLLSAGIALTGTLFGRDEDSIPVATTKIVVEGTVALLLLRLSIWINDCFILRHFNVMKEIRTDKNLGTAFCVAGSCIASGLILNGALTGFSSSFLHGLRDIVIYWLLGQLMLTMGAFVYQRMARCDVHQLIEYDDNAAVGNAVKDF